MAIFKEAFTCRNTEYKLLGDWDIEYSDPWADKRTTFTAVMNARMMIIKPNKPNKCLHFRRGSVIKLLDSTENPPQFDPRNTTIIDPYF